MSKVFKPMKGEALGASDLPNLKFPLFVGPKLDGFRCLAMGGEPKTSSLKTHTNLHIQKLFSQYKDELEGLDGELVVGAPNDVKVFDNTSGPVRRSTGEPDFTFWVFDRWDTPAIGFNDRHFSIVNDPKRFTPPFVQIVDNLLVSNYDELLQFEDEKLEEGYEGIMVRSLDGTYKYGRSTIKEGGLLKLKRFEDAEAIILGFEEEQFNGNEATVDNFGRTKRSSHQENKTGKGTLGNFLCRGVNGTFKGVEFKCSTGVLKQDECQKIWNEREAWKDTYITYTFFPKGCKDKPRFPRFVRQRPAFDVDLEFVEAA